MTTDAKTTSWTPEQQEFVDEWVHKTADELSKRINTMRFVLQNMDTRH